MREQITELIQQHKLNKQECFELLNELSQLDSSKMSPKEKTTLKNAIVKAEEEFCWRGIFIGQLENLL